jgi:hypothetical protein
VSFFSRTKLSQSKGRIAKTLSIKKDKCGSFRVMHLGLRINSF